MVKSLPPPETSSKGGGVSLLRVEGEPSGAHNTEVAGHLGGREGALMQRPRCAHWRRSHSAGRQWGRAAERPLAVRPLAVKQLRRR